MGTRGSRLALRQAEDVARRLNAQGTAVEPVIITTRGDRLPRTPWFGRGDVGVFVKELEQALMDGRIDFAVHSAKDIPTDLPSGFCLPAVLPRASAWDVFISPHGSLEDLPSGAVVGTSSIRRAAMLRRLRPDLRVIPARGNIDTRLRKLDEGDWQALILAAAGLVRMGWLEFRDGEAEPIWVLSREAGFGSDWRVTLLRPPGFLPAAGQGIVALECRADHPRRSLLESLDDAETRRAFTLEREVLNRIGGGCHLPAGILAEPLHPGSGPAGIYRLRAVVLDPRGVRGVEAEVEGPGGEPLAHRLWEALRRQPEFSAVLESVHAS